jgi:hypothetical protein
MIEASPSAYHRGMLALGKATNKAEETFYVAVLVKLFLSSPWSAVVLFSGISQPSPPCDLG